MIHLKTATRGICALTATFALILMLLWLMGGETRSFIAPRMKFNTAFAICLAAVALYLKNPRRISAMRRLWGNALALTALLIGGLTFIECLSGLNFGIDQMFAENGSGRMTPNAAVCIAIISAAILLLDSSSPKGPRWAQRWALLSGVISIFALIGYLFEIQGLYQVSQFIRLSGFTATSTLLLSTGILFSRPHYGIVKVLLNKNPSGMFVRRMLIATLICPPILGWFGLIATHHGYLSDSAEAAGVALATIVLFMSLVWHSAEAMSLAENALKKSEWQFRTMANSIPQMAWMADKTGAVYWYNQRWYEYTGTSFDEMRDSGWKKTLAPDQADLVIEKFHRHVIAGTPWEDTFPIRGKNGEWCWFLSRARPIFDADDNITSWFGTHTDITENRRVEQEINESKEIAERANLAKTQFLANMSHEIRTPIGAIIGFTELLKSPGTSETEKLGFMNIIERNSEQLLRLIDDILDLSKVEAGKIDLEKIEFLLPTFLNDFISVMRLKAEEKGILLTLDFDGKVPSLVRTDQLRLRQVLSNVVGNAIKFTDRGSVTLRVGYDKPQLTFTVTDTGPGISPENVGRLFQPFTQADPSMTRRYGGTGLGLILARRLSQALGGDLQLLKSELGQGSSFLIKIDTPLLTRATFDNPGQSPQSHSILNVNTRGRLSGMRILLIEDSADNRTLIKAYLHKAGAQIEEAVDGAEGFAVALKSHPDLVLMDIQMPRMDGHQATRKLREAGFRQPIIALTAHAMREERDRCFNSGCTDYLTKPIQRDLLLETVAHYQTSV